MAGRLVRRPALWPIALRQAVRTTPPGWWRRPPFRPGPPSDYAAFRFQTMYGGVGTPADAGPAAADDLVGWLAWARREPPAGRTADTHT